MSKAIPPIEHFDSQQVMRVRKEAFALGLLTAAILLAGEFSVFAIQTWLGEQGVRFARPEIWLDSWIPFVPEFVWPYWLYFIIVYMATWIPRTRYELAQILTGLLTINVIAWICFIVYPTAIDRPHLECAEALSCGFVGAMYMVDPGYALMPSLHVGNSVYVAACFFLWRHPLRFFIGVFALSIIAATVLIKQHYILDIPAGVLVAIVGGYGGFWLADYAWEHRLGLKWTAMRRTLRLM